MAAVVEKNVVVLIRALNCTLMLTYAHVCSRMLTYAHVCSRMQVAILIRALNCNPSSEQVLILLALLVQKYQ